MPTAELEVYYGFTKNFVRMHGQEQVDRYMEQLKQPGVTFHGTYRQCSPSTLVSVTYYVVPQALYCRGTVAMLECCQFTPVANQVLDRSIRRSIVPFPQC